MNQEEPGAARSGQEEPGGARRSQEAGEPRGTQGDAGKDSKYQWGASPSGQSPMIRARLVRVTANLIGTLWEPLWERYGNPYSRPSGETL